MSGLFVSLLSLLTVIRVIAIPLQAETRATDSWPDPICTGNCSYIHDPSVLQDSDGTYYRFSTFAEIAIATASSLDGPWTYQGRALPQGSSIDLAGNTVLWAPDVFGPFDDGSYIMYYAVSTSGSQDSDIGYATSTTLDPGSWTDGGSLGIPQDTAYNLIDPNLLSVNFGDSYQLTFGSYWDDIYQVQLSDPPTSLASGASPVHLEQNTTVRPDSLSTGPQEGSYQFWWTVDDTVYYYLFFSSGACCNTPPDLVPAGEEYKVMVCRSTSATGDFVDADGVDCLSDNGGTLVLGSHGDNVYAPGGQGVMYDDGVGSVVMYYHYVNPNIGYAAADFLFGYNKLDFTSGWPVVVS
ncbi:MAG: hypothetical protein M1834_002457 [Cirrosporium novae-zelandiae]|nr:MAG: hypothetical protein M1834_002457 [Cirrosporium novae-zelandiae]